MCGFTIYGLLYGLFKFYTIYYSSLLNLDNLVIIIQLCFLLKILMMGLTLIRVKKMG